MKKILLLTIMMAILAYPAFGFMYEVKILDKEAIAGLNNDQIVDTYTDVIVEVEASKVFHERAGFTPKEYEKYKQLLRFVINIRQEMSRREITPPPLTDWLK